MNNLYDGSFQRLSLEHSQTPKNKQMVGLFVCFDIKLYELFGTCKNFLFYVFNIFDANFYFSEKTKW